MFPVHPNLVQVDGGVDCRRETEDRRSLQAAGLVPRAHIFRRKRSTLRHPNDTLLPFDLLCASGDLTCLSVRSSVAILIPERVRGGKGAKKGRISASGRRFSRVILFLVPLLC